MHPDDYEKTVNMQMRVAASPAEGDAFSCTYRIRRADGSWLWVLGRGCVTSRDSQGRALRIVGMHTDISSLQHDRNVLEKKIRLDPLTGVYNRYHLDGLLQQVRKARGIKQEELAEALERALETAITPELYDELEREMVSGG